MCNEEIKMQFINELPETSHNTFRSLFNRAENYEEQIGCDIYDFDYKNCIGLLVELNPKSSSHVNSLKSQFLKYVNWAVENKIASRNYWITVPTDSSFAELAFRSRYVKDIDALEQIVKHCNTTLFDKYVFYLLYAGIMGDSFDELCTLLDSDVDGENKTITISRRTFTDIPEQFWDVYFEIKRIGLENINKIRGDKQNRDIESPYLIKPYTSKKLKGKPISLSFVYKLTFKMNEAYNKIHEDDASAVRIACTPKTIWYSGMFSKLREIEFKKGYLDYDDFSIILEYYGVEKSSNDSNIQGLLAEYALYKKVFH